ncbi:hypothetical protein A4S06_03850 [Erysipelotrichaceae bacterium MTC7]|nr:hypothetical protein A4S06_03850 [Erysipelotrichaceae bacterium MTC7]
METIRAYLEQMFKDLPKTKEVAEMKMNLQDHMEDAFQAHREAGMSETEAIKEVLQQFGDMDELLKELNIDKEHMQQDARYVSKDVVTSYMYKFKRRTFLICLGLTFIVIGIMLGYATSELTVGMSSDVLSGVGFFLPVAIAVGLFIYAGMSMDGYAYMKDRIEMDTQSKSEIIQAYSKSKKMFMIEIIVGVSFFLLAVAGQPLIEYFSNELIANLCFFVCIIVGVVLCTHAGQTRSMYRTLLNENYEELQKEKRKEEATDKIAPVVWILATAIYVSLGMIFGLWSTAWVVYLFAWSIIAIANVIKS